MSAIEYIDARAPAWNETRHAGALSPLTSEPVL